MFCEAPIKKMKIQYVAVILTGPKEKNQKKTNGHYLNQNWAKLLTFGVCHATLIFFNVRYPST